MIRSIAIIENLPAPVPFALLEQITLLHRSEELAHTQLILSIAPRMNLSFLGL